MDTEGRDPFLEDNMGLESVKEGLEYASAPKVQESGVFIQGKSGWARLWEGRGGKGRPGG